MAELNYKVNPDEQEKDFSPVPVGLYPVVIEGSDYTENKDKTGMILKLTYQIIDGKFKGQKLFENLNLHNKSQQAEEISRRSLNSIGIAVGVTDLRDSSLLHDIPLNVDVGIKESPEYGVQNKIKKHLPFTSQPQNGNSTSATMPVEEVSNETVAKPPWEKGAATG